MIICDRCKELSPKYRNTICKIDTCNCQYKEDIIPWVDLCEDCIEIIHSELFAVARKLLSEGLG